MKKLVKPQIYIFDNRTIANKLKDTYFVSQGTIGIITEAVLNAKEQKRYFNLKYEQKTPRRNFSFGVF